jgi:hypothetical protein
VCSILRKKAEKFLSKNESEKEHQNNLLFYVMMALRPFILKGKGKKQIRLRDVDVESVTDSIFASALAIVRPIYEKHGASDKAAKGTEILADLKLKLAEMTPKSAKKKPKSV